MDPVKIAFIINPKSGRRFQNDMEQCIRQNLDFDKYHPEFYYTKYSKHAYELAYQCFEGGCSNIIAVGGDGTVNEVGAAVTELNITMGILPTGSGNGLARHLGISTNLIKAVKTLNLGNVISMDVGKINTTWFFCTCGVGFDAKVGKKFSKNQRRGFFAYIGTVVKEYRKYKSKKYRFWIDGVKYRRKAFLITVANAAQYGNNAYIAPNARIDDGLFDIGILKPFPLFKSLIIGFRLFRGSLQKSKYHEVIRGKVIKFSSPKKKYIFHYDGEPKKYKKGTIKIQIYPKKLKIIVSEHMTHELGTV